MINIKTLIEKKYKILVFAFFALYLFLGLYIFKDYGISWDEHLSRRNGIVALKYILEKDEGLFSYKDRFHGPAFEMILVVIEKILNPFKNIRATYLIRHLFTFLLFYLGVIFFYRLTAYIFGSWKIGLLASIFLILSPTIFAHSFYNSKDIAFLSTFIMSIFTLIHYLDKKNFLNASIHALACAFLIDIRILGIIVPFFTFIFLVLDFFIEKTEKKKNIANLLLYIFLLVFFTILFWPLLWWNPAKHFIEALKHMSSFPWDGAVFYLGEYLSAKDLPWHYILVWIIISTPSLYIICFFIGCFILIKQLFQPKADQPAAGKSPLSFYPPSQKTTGLPVGLHLTNRNDTVVLFWFFLPLVFVIIFRPVVYDTWRHMFFVYPGLLIISLIGLIALFKFTLIKFKKSRKIVNSILVVFIVMNLINVAYFMVRYHPFQHIYFNLLAGGDMLSIKNNFELDYWGLSYRKALEYILKNDKSQVIKIYVADTPGEYSANILSYYDKKRLIYVNDLNEARYFLSNYRTHKKDYPYQEYYSIKIGGAKIMVVYKMD